MAESVPKYEVTLFWDLDMDVALTSKVVTGLVALSQQRKIRLRTSVGFCREETGRPPGGVMVWLEARRLPFGKPLRVTIDLHDLSFQFYHEALDCCDVYLKKSYYPPDIEKLPPSYRDKVIPFGFNFWCASNAGKWLVCRWLFQLYTPRMLAAPRKYVNHFRRRLGEYRVFLDGPVMKDYEQSPATPLEPRVVFQTRVWTPEEVGPDDHNMVNGQRVGIIRALKEGLGEQFIGGLVPTEFARQHYANLLATAPARRQLFIRWSKRNLIGVYVRGLNYSYGFRFAEHLAASQCIVAHPDGFRNPAPVPPQEAIHYLPFTTPEECLQQCRRLLSDGELAARMRHANWEYYRCEVEPAQHVWNCLERAFAHADARQ